MDLTGALYDAISRMCDVPLDAIGPDVPVDDLGLDSLAAAEVITDLEIRTGLELPSDALRRLADARTVGDITALVEAALAGSA